MRYVRQIFPFERPAELDSIERVHVPVIIVGAGPIGMAMGLDLDRQGIRSIILDDDNKVSIGSRAICWSKRALEVLDRLGCGERMLDKGVTWNLGKVFFGDDHDPVYIFNMLEEEDQQFPGFINLQQYYVEEYLIDEIKQRELTEIRWENEVTIVDQTADGVQAKLGPIVLELIQLLSTLWGLGPWRTVQQKLEKDWIELVSREPCEIKLAFTKLNPIVLELIQPVVGQSYWPKFIQAKGEGLNHVAFSVSDWQQMASNLQSAGGKMVAGGVQDGMHWGYFQAEPGGMVVELEEKLYGKQQFQV